MRLLYYPSIPDTLSPDEDDIRAGVSFPYFLVDSY
jgi:hypothetical protein